MKDWANQIHVGDCRTLLAGMAADDVGVQTCVTSPPYFGLRDYGHADQIGLEATPDDYVAQLVAVFRAVRDVLAEDGTLWLNLGDSYSSGLGGDPKPRDGNPEMNGGASNRNGVTCADVAPKNLLGIPWRVAFALQADGWYLRSDIIWHKPNPMPESVTDRPTKAHEYLFLMAKSERYYYDAEAIKEDGSLQKSGNSQHKYVNGQQLHRTKTGFLDMRQKVYEKVNRRTVWTIPSQPFSGAHFACFPRALIEPCILAGSKPGHIVLDPFMGSGTVAEVASSYGRQFIGCEINPAYAALFLSNRSQQTGFAL